MKRIPLTNPPRRWIAGCGRFFRCQRGAAAIEYGVIALLISVAIIVALQDLRGSVTGTYGAIETAVDEAGR